MHGSWVAMAWLVSAGRGLLLQFGDLRETCWLSGAVPRSGQGLAATGHIPWHGAEGGDPIPQLGPGVRVRASAASTVPIVSGMPELQG